MGNNHSKKTSKLQQWLENVWYNNGSGKFLLLPLTGLYCAANSFQRFKYSQSKPALPCPVIVIGNITIGGTGKTPLTIHVVKLLKRAGYKPGIITRGYGGQATSWPQKVTEKSDPQQVGDEAVLMAAKAQVPVYAGADRLLSIDALIKAHDCDVIVSDDGMQHYKLPRDIQIAVLDGSRMLGNGWCLPAGPLREKKRRLLDCDMVVVNGRMDKAKNTGLVAGHFHAMELKGSYLINLITKEKLSLDQFDSNIIHAVTGIGNPERFFNTLEEQGDFQLKKHSFPDHHEFVASDVQFNDESPVIMTEKDAVKCQKFATRHFWSLPVIAHLENDFEHKLLELLRR